jgi:hypothetical protein
MKKGECDQVRLALVVRGAAVEVGSLTLRYTFSEVLQQL